MNIVEILDDLERQNIEKKPIGFLYLKETGKDTVELADGFILSAYQSKIVIFTRKLLPIF